jgi:general L-amino acid transport system permease protein
VRDRGAARISTPRFKVSRKNSTVSQKARIPFYRNPAVRGVIAQIVVLGVVVWALLTIFFNTIHNLQTRGIQTGFSFLDQVAPFAVGFSPFIDFKLGESPYWLVFIIGVQNTIVVSVLGIIAATILGFLLGVARLSPNFFLARFASLYIETFRNIPILLQLMFWNFAVFLPLLPFPKDSIDLGGQGYLNNRGLFLPKIIATEGIGFWVLLIAVVVAIAAVILLNRWAKRTQYATGRRPPGVVYGLLIGIALVVLVLLVLQPVTAEYPEAGRFNMTGGVHVPLPLFSLWFALTTYTAAFIAENVRAGIQAVSHGQTEAAQSLGLKRGTMLRLVIIPQALRVIIPPTISQYLNLTKNSSLAVAVAYEELVSLWSGIALNQTGQALVIIGMTIAVYETLSLLTSAVLNWYNKRVQLVER